MNKNLNYLIASALNKIALLCLLMLIFGISGHNCLASDSDDLRPNEHICPITFQVMRDPVVAADGYSYERAAISKWFNSEPVAYFTLILSFDFSSFRVSRCFFNSKVHS